MMTSREATNYIIKFNGTQIHDEKDIKKYIECLELLIELDNDPEAMMELGGWYYEQKQFELALKYYEMAHNLGHKKACQCLGYIWYYGRVGEPDYEKAYNYYSEAMNNGDIKATMKVTDMYKNGYYVKKDYGMYVSMIEDLFQPAMSMSNVFDPVPEIFTRLSKIMVEKGFNRNAVDLLLYSREFLSQRIAASPFFGDLSIMKNITKDLYDLIEFNSIPRCFYDLYVLLEKPNIVDIKIEGIDSFIVSTPDGITFDDCSFDDIDDFMLNAQFDGHLLTELYDKIVIDVV